MQRRFDQREVEQVALGMAAAEPVRAGADRTPASFFNRLFRRKVMMSPTEYRRRFGNLRTRLREVAGSLE